MNNTIQKESRGHHSWWLTGIVGGLLFSSLGLELIAQQVFGHTDVGTLLWALYLGFWSFVLGVTGFLFLTTLWLVEWRHDGRNQKALNIQGGSSQPLSNLRAVNQNLKKAEPRAQEREPETAMTCL